MNTHSDSIFAVEIAWDKVLPKLQKWVMTDEIAKNALGALTKAGCDQELLLKRLYMFCGGSSRQVANAKNAFLRAKNRIEKLSRGLIALAPEIEWADAYLSDIGFVPFTQLADRVRAYAEQLGRLDPIFKDLASKRITGRDQHLVFLAKYVEIIAEREHYEELATLVNTIRGMDTEGDTKSTPRGVSPSLETADSIRKRVNRSVLDWESYGGLIHLAKNDQQREALEADFQKRLQRK